MERDMEETDTTRGLESPPLEGGGQSLPAPGRTVPDAPSFVYALGQIQPRFSSLAAAFSFLDQQMAQSVMDQEGGSDPPYMSVTERTQ